MFRPLTTTLTIKPETVQEFLIVAALCLQGEIELDKWRMGSYNDGRVEGLGHLDFRLVVFWFSG